MTEPIRQLRPSKDTRILYMCFLRILTFAHVSLPKPVQQAHTQTTHSFKASFSDRRSTRPYSRWHPRGSGNIPCTVNFNKISREHTRLGMEDEVSGGHGRPNMHIDTYGCLYPNSALFERASERSGKHKELLGNGTFGTERTRRAS